MATYNVIVNNTIMATLTGTPASYSATGVGYNLTTNRFFWVTGKSSVGLSLSAAGTTAGFELTTITDKYNWWCLIFPSTYSDILMEYPYLKTYWSFTKKPSNPAYSQYQIGLTTAYVTDFTNRNWFGEESGTYPITIIPFNMTEITITKDFTNLLTAQTYCDKDIQISAPLQNKSVYNVTDSTTIEPDDGFYGLKSAYFSVSKETKTVTPTTSSQTVTPSSGKVLSSVTVNAAPLDAAKTITAGTAATTVNPTGSNIGIKSVTINPTPSSAKTATPTKETQTVSPDSGKLLSSVTVNPIPDEYIIPSGTKDITANGTADVTSFASVKVNVPAPDLSDATATANKVLLGFTAYTGAGKITGTIPTYDGSLRVEMPVKGDLITIESKQYRVLKMNGSIAKLVSMDASATSAFGANNIYSGATIDTYCNTTFYGALSASVQAAIVNSTIRQDQYAVGDYSGSKIATYTATDANEEDSVYPLYHVSNTFGTQIERKCYALSISDIIEYLEVTSDMTSDTTTLTAANISMMLWNKAATSLADDNFVWFSSAGDSNSFCVISTMSTTIITEGSGTSTYNVRPTFQIDLSKIKFTK